MLIRLNGVSMAELESALKYTGLYLQVDESNAEYAEIKAIPQSLLREDYDRKPYTTLDLWETLGERLGLEKDINEEV
jgi:hypothetical protein